MINHEIKSKDLEVVDFPLGVNHQGTGPNGISGYFFHERIDLFKEIIPPIILPIQIRLKLSIRQLVPLLILPIVWKIFLHCVIRQVNRGQTSFCGISVGCRSDVP